MTPGRTRRLVLAALTIALSVWLFAACAAGRPTSLTRLPGGYEILTAHCAARAPESCTPIRVTGDPRDEEAWGFRARPAANALWKEPQVLYAVGDQARCDAVRAMLDTPSEACWGPVYFRREWARDRLRKEFTAVGDGQYPNIRYRILMHRPASHGN